MQTRRDDPRAAAARERRFTEEEAEFLKHFAHNYTTGRRVLCFFAHAIVSLGALAIALAAIATAFHAGLGSWRPIGP